MIVVINQRHIPKNRIGNNLVNSGVVFIFDAICYNFIAEVREVEFRRRGTLIDNQLVLLSGMWFDSTGLRIRRPFLVLNRGLPELR